MRELRLKQLHQEIMRQGSFTVEDGARVLSVSKETIRRDLEYLSKLGLVVRTRGGAAAPGVALTEVDLSQRAREHHDEKVAIAWTAVERLIVEGSSVALDTGSTTLEVARLLRSRQLIVVTNSLPVVNELVASECSVVVLGGMLRDRSLSTVGPYTESAAREFHCDLALVSAPAISTEFGLMDTDLEAVATKRALIRSASRSYAVLDHSKFGRRAFTSICAIDDLTGIVTDSSVPADALDPYRSAGLDVIVATGARVEEPSHEHEAMA